MKWKKRLKGLTVLFVAVCLCLQAMSALAAEDDPPADAAAAVTVSEGEGETAEDLEETDMTEPAEPAEDEPQTDDADVREEAPEASQEEPEEALPLFDIPGELVQRNDLTIPDPEEEEEAEEEEEVEEAEPEEELREEEEEEIPTVSYRTHVQTYGWQGYVRDGASSGTSGEAKRLEAIRIRVTGVKGLGVEYRTHVQTFGWQDYVKNNAVSGTSGLAKRLEGINIRLIGSRAKDFDIYYRVHIQTYGWLNWAKNGEMAGSEGLSKRLEAIQIIVQKKGDPAPSSDGSCSVSCVYANIRYQTHVQTYGWQNYVSNGSLSGTTGESKRLEGIRIQLGNTSLSGSVKYRTHVQTYGWEKNFSADGAMSGTQGESKRLEAIQIKLTGEIAEYFDIYYRTHVQRFGWTGWACNGASCGSEGCAFRLEGIEIRLIPKNGALPGSTENTFFTRTQQQNEMIDKAQQYDSYTNWLLLVNRTTHRTGIFTRSGNGWSLYKELVCSDGAPYSPTVEGTFTVQSKILYFGTSTYRC